MTDSISWVSVARLIRPQGRRGEILSEILTHFPERFLDLHDAYLSRGSASEPVPIKIEGSWLHKGRIVLKFAGTDSISAAETLRGAEVVIPAAERVELDAEAVYIGELIGCEVVDVGFPGHPIAGTIRDVIQQPETTDLLVVCDPNGDEHLIPFAKAYTVHLDVAARRLEMKLPQGLMEVNAPLTEEERRVSEEQAAEEGHVSEEA